MIEKIKRMPTIVKLSYAFLILLYVAMWVIVPPMATGFTLTVAAVFAVARVVDYDVNGE